MVKMVRILFSHQKSNSSKKKKNLEEKFCYTPLEPALNFTKIRDWKRLCVLMSSLLPRYSVKLREANVGWGPYLG
jgi:hypothetical protein